MRYSVCLPFSVRFRGSSQVYPGRILYAYHTRQKTPTPSHRWTQPKYTPYWLDAWDVITLMMTMMGIISIIMIMITLIVINIIIISSSIVIVMVIAIVIVIVIVIMLIMIMIMIMTTMAMIMEMITNILLEKLSAYLYTHIKTLYKLYITHRQYTTSVN